MTGKLYAAFDISIRSTRIIWSGIFMLGLLLLVIKASLTDLTQDEAALVFYRDFTLADIFNLTPGPKTANNHPWITLWFRICHEFGLEYNSLVIRLPSIAAYMVFMYALWQLSGWFSRNWVRIVFVLMVLSQVLVLDCFALARGYGIGMAGLAMAILCGYRSHVMPWSAYFYGMLFWLLAACISNLSFFVPAAAVLFWAAVLNVFSSGQGFSFRRFINLWPLWVVIIVFALSALLYFIPAGKKILLGDLEIPKASSLWIPISAYYTGYLDLVDIKVLRLPAKALSKLLILMPFAAAWIYIRSKERMLGHFLLLLVCYFALLMANSIFIGGFPYHKAFIFFSLFIALVTCALLQNESFPAAGKIAVLLLLAGNAVQVLFFSLRYSHVGGPDFKDSFAALKEVPRQESTPVVTGSAIYNSFLYYRQYHGLDSIQLIRDDQITISDIQQGEHRYYLLNEYVQDIPAVGNGYEIYTYKKAHGATMIVRK